MAVIDPDATPEPRFRAWLAGNEPEPPPGRVPWCEGWRHDAEAFLALAGVLAVSAALGWWRA